MVYKILGTCIRFSVMVPSTLIMTPTLQSFYIALCFFIPFLKVCDEPFEAESYPAAICLGLGIGVPLP
jgi:hypothetical protein